MCLTGKYGFHSTTSKVKKIGYKLYNEKSPEGTYSYIYGEYKPRKWYHAADPAKATEEEPDDSECYKGDIGFHIIKSSEYANAVAYAKEYGYVLCRVEYKDVNYSGWQFDMDCVVADRMRIVCEVVTAEGKVRKYKPKTPKVKKLKRKLAKAR